MDRTSKAQPTSRASRFSEILKLKNAAPEEVKSETAEPAVENQTAISAEVVESPPSKEPAALPAPVEPVEVETKPKGRRAKVSKRSNPDYMQAIFHLPTRTSKRLDRELLDLGEAGVDLDRSEFAELLLQSFFRLSEQVGAAKALKQFKRLESE